MIVRTTATHTNRLWRRLPSWQRAALAHSSSRRRSSSSAGSRAAVARHAGRDRASGARRSTWPIVAVHMSLVPTGQGVRVRRLRGRHRTPRASGIRRPGRSIPVPYGRNLFCAGHIQLADGRTLLVGGHITPTSASPTRRSSTRRRRTYFRGPDMSVGRWYPTATQLARRSRAHVRRRQHRPGPARRDAAASRTRRSTRCRRSTTRRRTRGPTSRARG